jgi:hypothetical protein
VLLDGVGQGLRELGTVEAVDGVEQGDGVERLVGLQRANQAELQVGVVGAPRAPAGLGFLDAVFAEQALAGRDHGVDALAGLLL